MSTSKTNRHRWSGTRLMRQYRPPSQGSSIYDTQTDTILINANDTVTYGDNIPDWRSRIRLGMDATTVLSGYKFQVKLFDGSCLLYYTDTNPNGGYGIKRAYNGALSAAYVGFNVPTSAASVTADNKARSKFLSKYIDATNTWRGGNFLAEIGETVHMLRHPVKALFDSTFKFAKEVTRLRRIPVRHLRKTVSDAWLTWAFGVQPLIADCNDAAKALNKLRTRGGTGHDKTTITGRGRETYIDPNYVSAGALNMAPGDPGNASVFYRFSKVDLNVYYKACIRARLEDRSTVLEQFGVSPHDFAPAVWEAIPWSFFIDYFVNVQEMIDSLRLASADVSWCYRGIRNAATYNCLPVGYRSTSSEVGFLGGGGFWTLATYVNRVPSGIPFPNFHFQVPGIGSTKWLNIAALREQVFKATR